MNIPPLRERGLAPVFAIGIIALIVFGGAIMYAINQDRSEISLAAVQRDAQVPKNTLVAEVKPAAAGKVATTDHSSENTSSASALRTELEKALQSGGIHPSRLADIEREIDALAATGADVTELRTLLGKLSVGGSTAQKSPSPQPPPKQEEARVDTRPFWEFDPSKLELGWYWAQDGGPPACPETLIIPSPVDLNLVTAILYPGQVRGDGPKDFKPHGGFTLKAGTKALEIRAPMDGYLTSVAKFTDEFGLHYGLGFVHPCGILWGGGHFGKLAPDIEAAIEKIPLKGYKESPTEQLIPPYFVKKGQIIVIGLQEKANPERPGFDWGIADYRQPNSASQDPRFQSLYGYAPWNTYYGVCWLDWLPPAEEAAVRSFPGGDGKEGKNSEYCK